MASLSTPLNQIRNQSQMAPQHSNTPLHMPVYNPNIPSAETNQQPLPPTMPDNFQINNATMPQQNMSSGGNLVDELLNELEAQPEFQQDINVAHTQYAMDSINVPPTKAERDAQMLQSEQTQAISTSSDGNFLGSNNDSFDNTGYQYNPSKKSFAISLLDELKPTLIVLVLFLILSLHQVNRVIFSFLPQLLLENGQLSLYAILLKSVLAAGLFYGFCKLL